jgi:hypothetical protein
VQTCLMFRHFLSFRPNKFVRSLHYVRASSKVRKIGRESTHPFFSPPFTQVKYNGLTQKCQKKYCRFSRIFRNNLLFIHNLGVQSQYLKP